MMVSSQGGQKQCTEQVFEKGRLFMKLKTIKNSSSAIKYQIEVFTKDNEYVETIKLNYLEDKEILYPALDRYFFYENQLVKNITVRDNWLVITITI